MARLKRKNFEDASKTIASLWPFRYKCVDAASCSGDALVLISLNEINRAYQYGIEDTDDDCIGRRAPIEVYAFSTSGMNDTAEEQCHA